MVQVEWEEVEEDERGGEKDFTSLKMHLRHEGTFNYGQRFRRNNNVLVVSGQPLVKLLNWKGSKDHEHRSCFSTRRSSFVLGLSVR